MLIRLKEGETIREIEAGEGETVLEALRRAGVYLPALCAGRGSCGKCRARLLRGKLKGADETKAGDSFLACKAYPQPEVLLEVIQEEEAIHVETASGISVQKPSGRSFIAVDIGATTIAMALAEEATGEVKNTYAALNRQRVYGADVISRIFAANEGALGKLSELIREDLHRGISSLTEEGHIRPERVVIAANTTMIHLLMGYPCQSLGQHPFISEHLGLLETSLSAIAPAKKAGIGMEDVPLTLLPGISAFVGGDIVSGLLACPGFGEKGISLLLDMGTNGEMAIGSRDRLICASAAAGPAFEGANLVCGTGSIPGAIHQVKIRNRRPVIGAIGGKRPPVGICGTGAISAIAELKRNRLMDRDGALSKPYDEKGYVLWDSSDGEKIALYQQDIRQFQLAKAAIRAGLEQLMEAFGCRPTQVDRVYLAGGFGAGLPVKEAVEIGLLPEEFAGKTISIGNGALLGAVAYGAGAAEKKKELARLISGAESLSLALSEGFEERYLGYLGF